MRLICLSVLILIMGSCSYTQTDLNKFPKKLNDQKILISNDYLICSDYDTVSDQCTLYQINMLTNKSDSMKLNGLVNISNDLIWKTDRGIFEIYFPKWPLSGKPEFIEGDSIAIEPESIDPWGDSLILRSGQNYIVADNQGKFQSAYRYFYTKMTNAKKRGRVKIKNFGKKFLKFITAGDVNKTLEHVPKAEYEELPAISNITVLSDNKLFISGFKTAFSIYDGFPDEYSSDYIPEEDTPYYIYKPEKVQLYKNTCYYLLKSEDGVYDPYDSERSFFLESVLLERISPEKEILWRKELVLREDTPKYKQHYRRYEDCTIFFVQNMTIDSDENIYLYGETEDRSHRKFSFKTTKLSDYEAYNRSAFIIKIDKDGNIVWSKSYRFKSPKQYVTALNLSFENDKLMVLLLKRDSHKKSYEKLLPRKGIYFRSENYRMFDQYIRTTIDHNGEAITDGIRTEDLDVVMFED